MKQLQRILSLFLVVLMLFAGYVAAPAAAHAEGSGSGPAAVPGEGEAVQTEGDAPQGEEPQAPLPVVPAEEGGEETPLPADEAADEADEQPAAQETPAATPEAAATEGDLNASPLPDGALEQEEPAQERVSIFTSARQPLQAITMAEFEELLALQPALTAEDMEAYLIRTEDADGSGTVELYLSPVRYRTASGAWRMIDPAITVTAANGKQTLASADAPVRIDFLTSVSEDRLVTLSRDGYELSLAPVPESGLLRSEAYDVRYLPGATAAARAGGDPAAQFRSIQHFARKFQARQLFRRSQRQSRELLKRGDTHSGLEFHRKPASRSRS